jgi:hypothetical protein
MAVVGAAALAFVAAGAAGATPSTGEPAGDHGDLSRAGQVPAALNLVALGVQFLEVTVRRPPGPPTSDVSVTSPAKIRRIAALINGLNTAQPGAIDCTGEADDPVVTFTFRSADGGRALARARQVVGQDMRVAACEPMTLTIKGRTQTPLLGGGRVVRAAHRLLGISLTRHRTPRSHVAVGSGVRSESQAR